MDGVSSNASCDFQIVVAPHRVATSIFNTSCSYMILFYQLSHNGSDRTTSTFIIYLIVLELNNLFTMVASEPPLLHPSRMLLLFHLGWPNSHT